MSNSPLSKALTLPIVFSITLAILLLIAGTVKYIRNGEYLLAAAFITIPFVALAIAGFTTGIFLSTITYCVENIDKKYSFSDWFTFIVKNFKSELSNITKRLI